MAMEAALCSYMSMIVLWSGRKSTVEAYSTACSLKYVAHIRICRREAEAKESWRAEDSAAAEEFKRSQIGKWGFGAEEIIMNSNKILRVRYTFLIVTFLFH
jgi:hypothetical protein